MPFENAGINDVHELAHLLAKGLPLADKPYAIFGACLGAIIGYEMVKEVERIGSSPLPLVYMPAAAPPPHLYAQRVAKTYLHPSFGGKNPSCVKEPKVVQEGWLNLPKQLLNGMLGVPVHPADLEAMNGDGNLHHCLASLMAKDVVMALKYRPSRTEAVPVPILAFEGAQDVITGPGLMVHWQQYTAGLYRHVLLPGGKHDIVSSHAEQVTHVVGPECVKLIEQMRRHQANSLDPQLVLKTSGDNNGLDAGGRSRKSIPLGRQLRFRQRAMLNRLEMTREKFWAAKEDLQDLLSEDMLKLHATGGSLLHAGAAMLAAAVVNRRFGQNY